MEANSRKEIEYRKRKELALKIVDGLADTGMRYREANSVLRMATNELGNRRSNEIMKKTPQNGDA